MGNNKLVGILSVFFGIFGFVAISLIEKGKLIFNDSSDPFIVKYSLMIGLINCCLLFIICGLLLYCGFIVPHYSINKTELDGAKNNVVGIIILIPLWISVTASIFIKPVSITGKIIWVCLLLYFALSLWDGIKKLREKPGCEVKGRKR